jgi:hypothetical protein
LAFHSGREGDHSPNTPSWRGAQLGGAQGQLYIYLLQNGFLYLNLLWWLEILEEP